MNITEANRYVPALNRIAEGVLVETVHNPQLMLYAIGALNAFESLYDITEVSVTIFQPRHSDVSTWTTQVGELDAWAEQVVKPRAALAASGDREFAPGERCRFCKLAPTCRTRTETNLALAQHEFAPPAELTDAKIAQGLTKLPNLKAWAADVAAHALSLAMNQGKSWPGFKLVEGHSIRKYAAETAVATDAEAAGVDVWDRKFKTITMPEKQLGNRRFTTLLGDPVLKLAGKPTPVPESDKIPALEFRSRANEFTAIN